MFLGPFSLIFALITWDHSMNFE
jgi:hypothetical protein